MSSNSSQSSSKSRLVLASGSPYRAQLLGKIVADFDCQPADIDESPAAGEKPLALARRLARQKAETIASQRPGDWVLGSDQVAVLVNGEATQVLGKPGTHDRALAQLRACSGKRVEFITACSLLQADTAREINFDDSFALHFREYDDAEIEAYLLRDKPYDCAGSIKSEAGGVALIARYEGDDPNTLVGLPLIKLRRALLKTGWQDWR